MEIKYQVVHSRRRKRLTLTVERDRTIVVRAPEGTSEEEVRRIVDAKRQWILAKTRHPQKYQNLIHPPGKEVVNGESAPYLGRDYKIEVTETASGEVEFLGLFLVPPTHRKNRREVLREWYVARAKETVLARTERHARELGVEFNSARIVDSRYRWGSCTEHNHVTFNWRIIKAPMFVIDYVVVHELAHLIEANHTAQFWAIVRAKSPTMEKAKAWLKAHGQLLEQDI